MSGHAPHGDSAVAVDAPVASVVVDARHADYVRHGAVTADQRLPDYEGAEPEPGTLLIVVDRDWWATLHRVERRSMGQIEFGPRVPWPDGSIAARKAPRP